MQSVLGEFSSGVSICRNKGLDSDLEALFLLAPGSGYGVPFPRHLLKSK